VQAFNQGVDRIDRNAAEKADVSLIVSGGGNATGLPFLRTALESGANLTGMLARFVDARVGTALDRVRGWINRVPSQSVRLYKAAIAIR